MAKTTTKARMKARAKGTRANAASPIASKYASFIVTLAPDAGPNAYALQFLASHRVVFFVRQGREASDEAALRKQILARDGAPLVVSFNGSPAAKVFDSEVEPGVFFRVIALVQ